MVARSEIPVPEALRSLGVPAPADNPIRGMALMFLSVFLFSITYVLTKWLTQDYSVQQTMFFRSVFSLVLVMIMALWWRRRGIWRTQRIGAHLLRGLFGLSAMFTLVLALSLLPIADVTACIFAAPIFATALSVPILKENVGLRRWSAIMMGFVGVLVIVRPGMEGFQPAILVAIAAALFFAMASNAIRSIAQSEDGLTIVFYFMMLLALVSGFALPFGWRMPDLVGSILFIGLGLCGGAGQILMTAAYRLAPVAVIMPLEYTTLLWTSLFGYWLWGEVMTAGTIAGAGLVVASGLYIVHREAVLRRARS